jgi:hypothetical protein
MAHSGTGYFDSKGQYYKTPNEATISDLSNLLGRVGDGESLAPGIAHIMLEKRTEIEKIFADHDDMLAAAAAAERDQNQMIDDQDGKVAPLRPVR